MIRLSFVIALFVFVMSCYAQHSPAIFPITLQDTLRGSVTPERAWWDVNKYDITVRPFFETKTIAGTNVIGFTALESGKRMQIDLQQPMQIDEVLFRQKKLAVERNGNVYYVNFPENLAKGARGELKISFSGRPREAVNPPWDGGWIWKRDSYGNPWMSVACQGLGASVWYPCKDHQGDEPEGALLTMIVPDTLKGVGNGRLITPVQSVHTPAGFKAYTWQVVNPINNYNIVPYIGNYVHWNETFRGEKGPLDINYWVLQENDEKAKRQFAQVIPMLKCFEHWFGPYPFYEDGYKLVESPHLGMEHQSAIAYGNKFANGYLGSDLSGTGWGKKWDFIIIHESAHEWFANNITTTDIADMWVHEGFTNYSEVLYLTCQFGKAAGDEYCRGLRKNIQNDQPLIGPYGVNKEGSGDMYAKGSNLVHIIRLLIDDDEKFRMLLRKMNEKFYHRTTTSHDVEEFIIRETGIDLTKVFDQYLRNSTIPTLEFSFEKGKYRFRWTDCISGFNMPLKIYAGKPQWIYPTTEWKSVPAASPDLTIDPNFYIHSRKK